MAFELPPLPYGRDALAPHMSERTLDFHYGKHHAAYVKKLNELIAGTPHEESSLEAIIRTAPPGPLFNNAAQAWNHTFFWGSMRPDGGGDPEGELKAAIEASFGSIGECKQRFTDAATSLFGSGWTWLVAGDAGVEILQTEDADCPLTHGRRALLTLDVWEHAYYLDYQNARPAYVETWLTHLVDWEAASARFAA